MQSPEYTVAESTDNTEATNPVDRPSPKRRRPLHARIAPSGPKRRRPVAEIIHPEQQDTALPPLSQSAPKTVSAIIKATEGVAPPPPKGVPAHQWPPQRGPPSPLPTFIKFADLKAAGRLVRLRSFWTAKSPWNICRVTAMGPSERQHRAALR